MEIQARDIKLVQCCYEQQFLVMQHIEKFFFKNVAAQQARKRVLELERAGLIRSEKLPAFGHRKILRVTSAGRALATRYSHHEIPNPKRIDAGTIMHDVIVTSVRLRLSELWDGIWVPEKALKDRYTQIPDGLFQFEESGRAVAVEVENSHKGKTRFLSILKEWARVEGISLVLYVATTPDIFERIKTLLGNAAPHRAFGVILYVDLLAGTPKAHSPRGELDLFSRRTV